MMIDINAPICYGGDAAFGQPQLELRHKQEEEMVVCLGLNYHLQHSPDHRPRRVAGMSSCV
jgi:hypothetical protein